MRITIENFGAIKHFEFDTDKDMYLIFGKNSVGKSYGISLIYLILKSLKKDADSASKVNLTLTLSKYFDDDQYQDSVLNSESMDKVKSDLIDFLNASFIADLNISLTNTFNHLNNLQNQFGNDQLRITLDFVSSGAIFELGMEEENDGMAIKIINYQFKQVFDSLYKKVTNITKNNFNASVMFIASRLYTELPNREVYYLPASRSGIYQGLGSFAQIAAELSKSRSLISKPIHLPTIAEPIADYFLRLSEMDNNNQTGLTAYTDDIENEIMSGQVEFDNETKRLFFRPKGTQLKLDLSSTSSMVSEMAPIVAYLKHVLPSTKIKAQKEGKEVTFELCDMNGKNFSPRPLIFIEEPEAHLHPETQVKLMNVFARLVKDGKIKLVMTSHSNYIFNKASNLVMDSKIDPDKFKAVLFRMTERGSVAENMATDAYGIDDDNFIDTAESLYEEKLAIINKLNG